MQADRVVPLCRHMQRCDTKRRIHEQIGSVVYQQLNDFDISTERSQVQGRRSQLSTIAEVDIVGQAALEPLLLFVLVGRLFDLPVNLLSRL